MENDVGVSVAVVDDDPELVKTYLMILRRRKVPVTFVACDGMSALDMFRKAGTKPSVLIIDHRMPLMNGIELTREVKKIAPGTRIIYISADDSIRQQALNAGVSIFLKKPVSVKAIVDAVRGF